MTTKCAECVTLSFYAFAAMLQVSFINVISSSLSCTVTESRQHVRSSHFIVQPVVDARVAFVSVRWAKVGPSAVTDSVSAAGERLSLAAAVHLSR